MSQWLKGIVRRPAALAVSGTAPQMAKCDNLDQVVRAAAEYVHLLPEQIPATAHYRWPFRPLARVVFGATRMAIRPFFARQQQQNQLMLAGLRAANAQWHGLNQRLAAIERSGGRSGEEANGPGPLARAAPDLTPRTRHRIPAPRDADVDVVQHFATHAGPGVPGYCLDFLGTRTRTSVTHNLQGKDGMVEGYPIPSNFHATTAEWAGTLRAVLEAIPSRRLVVMELGAGWGPWLVASAAAARQVGIDDVRLVGVEGSIRHCELMRQHFLDNDLDPAAHQLIHGVAAAKDGQMEFPLVEDPAADYGASVATDAPIARPANEMTHSVRAYSLHTLLATFELVDLLHVDIQGSEVEVIHAAASVLKRKVRRLVIGTHGRTIEQQLFDEMSRNGWVLESDEACQFRQEDRGMVLTLDGCQVWRNSDT